MKRKSRGIKAKGKFAFILFAFMAVLCVMLGRVVYWKTAHGAEFEAAAKNQQINRYDLVNAANRGSILDRNEQVLAVSTAVYNVALDPLQLADEKDEEEQERTLTTLCEYFPDLKYEDLKYHITIDPATGKINTPNHWKYLVKGIERTLKEQLEAEKLMGVHFEQTSKRSYPLKSLACHLIGFVRGDTAWGLEGYYGDEMTGIPGRSFILYQGNDSVTYQDYEAEDGNTVVTTLDYTIQQYAEEAVQETMTQWPSQNVAAMVMNPNTGEIYAMAAADRFDLNDPDEPLEATTNENFRETWEAMTDEEKGTYLNKMWRNFCVSDTYEPGSVYKPLVVAAALEEGVITKNSTFYCGGKIDVYGTDMRCHLRSGHGTISVEEIMAQSCNPGVIQIAQKLGAEKFYKYQREFGFGQRTGIDLPAEGNSVLHSPSAIGPTELATMAFGQSFTCTSVQMATAFSALINGGNLVQPYVVSQIVDDNGAVVMENDTEVVRKVISQKTSDYVRTALKATVERGTGKKIQIPGYSIGCKTGTAEQGDRSRDDLWTLTHMAYFPAENPQYMVFSVIHLPDDYTDGVQTTATMTKKLMENIIKYKNLEPTETTDEAATLTSGKTVDMPDYVGSSTYHVTMDLDGKGLNYKVVGTGNTITNQVPKGGTKVEVGSEVILYVAKSEEDSGTVKVPNVTGKTYTEAVKILSDEGFEVVFEGEVGNSIVTAQDPKHGVSVAEGSEIKITLTKQETPETGTVTTE